MAAVSGNDWQERDRRLGGRVSVKTLGRVVERKPASAKPVDVN
jgi:hypothetical protein